MSNWVSFLYRMQGLDPGWALFLVDYLREPEEWQHVGLAVLADNSVYKPYALEAAIPL